MRYTKKYNTHKRRLKSKKTKQIQVNRDHTVPALYIISYSLLAPPSHTIPQEEDDPYGGSTDEGSDMETEPGNECDVTYFTAHYNFIN